MPANILTDRKLAALYEGLADHYKQCKRRAPEMTQKEIYDELYNGVYFSLNLSYESSLNKLDPVEKQKAYTVLNTFFSASPSMPRPQEAAQFFRSDNTPILTVHHHHHYQPQNNFLRDYLLINALTSRRSHVRSYQSVSSSSSAHQHAHNSPNKKDDNTLAKIALAAVAACIVAAGLIALYYLTIETLNSIERFHYNEGWLQAALPMMSIPIGATVGGILGTLFAAPGVAMIAIAAGASNPLGWVIFAIISVGLVGAASASLITRVLTESLIKNANPDALDITDPHRFTLTATEAKQLEKNKGLDPVKVKCAIVALRREMGEESINSMFSFRSKNVQNCLDKIRNLRRGKSSQVNVGEMYFDCRKDNVPQPVHVRAAQAPYFFAGSQAHAQPVSGVAVSPFNPNLVPSAPAYELPKPSGVSYPAMEGNPPPYVPCSSSFYQSVQGGSYPQSNAHGETDGADDQYADQREGYSRPPGGAQ